MKKFNTIVNMLLLALVTYMAVLFFLISDELTSKRYTEILAIIIGSISLFILDRTTFQFSKMFYYRKIRLFKSNLTSLKDVTMTIGTTGAYEREAKNSDAFIGDESILRHAFITDNKLVFSYLGDKTPGFNEFLQMVAESGVIKDTAELETCFITNKGRVVKNIEGSLMSSTTKDFPPVWCPEETIGTTLLADMVISDLRDSLDTKE